MADDNKVEEKVVEEKNIFVNKPKLFGKWEYDEIKVKDPCF